MTIILLVFFAVALAHFIYEGIIAPSLRLELRCAIFKERDRLRSICASNRDDVDTETFNTVHDTINTGIRLVSVINPFLIAEAGRFVSRNASLRKAVERRNKLIEQSRLPELQEISREARSKVRDALFVNSAGLLIWVFPAFIAVMVIQKVTQAVRDLLLIPPSNLNTLVPREDPYQPA